MLERANGILPEILGPQWKATVRMVPSVQGPEFWIVGQSPSKRPVQERLELPKEIVTMDRQGLLGAFAEAFLDAARRVSFTERPAAAYIKA